MKTNNRNVGHSTVPAWRLIAHSYSKRLAADSQLRKSVPFPKKTQQVIRAALPLLDSTGAKTVWLAWKRSEASRCPCALHTLFNTHQVQKGITRSLIIQILNNYIGKIIPHFIRNCKRMAGNLNVCKRMVNHCLTFGNSWGICKKKFNI